MVAMVALVVTLSFLPLRAYADSTQSCTTYPNLPEPLPICFTLSPISGPPGTTLSVSNGPGNCNGISANVGWETVTFDDLSTPVPNVLSTGLAVPDVAQGSYQVAITFEYLGGFLFNSCLTQTVFIPFTVTAGDFAQSPLCPTTLDAAAPGGDFCIPVVLTPTVGSGFNVDLSVASPSGAPVATIVPASGTLDPLSATIEGVAPSSPGSYVYIVTATGAGMTHTFDYTLDVGTSVSTVTTTVTETLAGAPQFGASSATTIAVVAMGFAMVSLLALKRRKP